ncbi:unnamed protein product, partial [Rotaria sp. Silwood1]
TSSTNSLYLAAAQLRLETMYDEINCWLHPDIHYVPFERHLHGTLICTRCATQNMDYQQFINIYDQYRILAEFFS